MSHRGRREENGIRDFFGFRDKGLRIRLYSANITVSGILAID